MIKICNENQATFYTVQKGDTLEKICAIFGIEQQIIRQNNHLDGVVLEHGDVVYIPCQNVRCHVVAPLDTLSKIAQKYNVTEKQILEKNHIATLFIGQKIYL